MSEPEGKPPLVERIILGAEIITALAVVGWLGFRFFEANPGLAKLLLQN